jgi:hypothetical protein
MFRPDTVYPQLHVVDLCCKNVMHTLHFSEAQLQELCISCPATDHLAVSMCEDMSPTALAPLLELSALTHLEVYQTRNMAPTAAEAALHIIKELTWLKQLKLWGLPLSLSMAWGHTHPVFLQLTALTGLEEPEIRGPFGTMDELWFDNKLSLSFCSAWMTQFGIDTRVLSIKNNRFCAQKRCLQ